MMALTPEMTTIWLGLITAGGAGLAAYINRSGSAKERRLDIEAAFQKDEEERAQAKLQRDALREASLIEQLQEEVGSLRKSRQEDSMTIRQLFTEFNELKALQLESNIGIKILINQIIEHGDTPRWIPTST